MVVKRQIRCIGKFWFHSSLDVLGARRVSAKVNSEEASVSMGKDWIQGAAGGKIDNSGENSWGTRNSFAA